MKYGLFIAALFCAFVTTQSARAQSALGEVVAEPICVAILNTADFRMYGRMGTNVYINADGSKGRHTSNFNLAGRGAVSDDGHPTDRVEFCFYGPFYPGRKVELVLKTLFPVFECKTRIDQGPIYIEARPRSDGNGYHYSATCYE